MQDHSNGYELGGAYRPPIRQCAPLGWDYLNVVKNQGLAKMVVIYFPPVPITPRPRKVMANPLRITEGTVSEHLLSHSSESWHAYRGIRNYFSVRL